ncbi:nuclear transport factor 2 family protein [Desulfofustis glycolicus]|uniref:SnoaL-like domain-containing protein n=1 Tax=Desulfofustis glycolicus DSM 9705 TaxID=1121409 RepID=A0A1M5W222_9BACT|nr:nuclear transport factor 2 family protein [Desulfofustis glycolicus]SHH81274.1 hypothetical protein SAMN02745124_02023 [Desulfofustis glycolicus DSM 9705]
MENNTLTESQAATAYAQAWNRLDCRKFLELLAKDCCYASQYVFEELIGREKISEYLVGKIQSVIATRSKVIAGLGALETPNPGRDCALLFQNNTEEITAVILFEVENGAIKRYDLCMPELFSVHNKGIYPV